MSEKVTFQELIDSIAKETNNSKKFTHDFLKDLVAVINTGLEQDGSVNIAGFGKFKLRRMEEREGYNPQTGEKMTIDAHNKVVFKPYKALRELVNAPYSDLEPELLDEAKEEQLDESQEVTEETSEMDEAPGEQEQGFIPTGPPPAVTSEEEAESTSEKREADEEDEAPWEGDEAAVADEEEKVEESGKEDPFGITDTEMEEGGDELEIVPEEEEEDGDIIEFEEPEEEEREPSPLDQHLSKVKEKENQESSDEEANAEPEAPQQQSGMHPEPEEEESKSTFLPFVDKNRAPTWIWGAAAVIGLLIIVLAILYIGSGNGAEEPAQTVTTAQDQTQQRTEEVVEEPVTGDAESAEGTPSETQQQSGAQIAGQAETQEQPLQLQTSTYVERSVARGQTLWGLAEREYEDPYLWPWIYDANKATIRNPDIILVGQTLSIPVPDEPNNGLSTSDSLEVAIGYVETYRWYKDHGNDQAKFYLWAAKIYDRNVFDHITQPIDADDLAFANRVR